MRMEKARVGLKDGRIVEHLAEIAKADRVFGQDTDYAICIVREAREILLHHNLHLVPARASKGIIIITVEEGRWLP